MTTNSIRVWFTDRTNMKSLAEQVAEQSKTVSELSQPLAEKTMNGKFKLEKG